MTETMFMERLDKLTSAVLLMASLTGTRLNKQQLAERMGVHRNTLPTRTAVRGFPKPETDGKWLLSDIIEYEQGTT